MKAYHYSLKTLPLGSILTSVQTRGMTYQSVWQAYREVADTLRLYFPAEYGYAYPHIKEKFTSLATLHEVSATSKYVTCGNLNHSLLISMNRLHDFTDRDLPLEERFKKRHQLLKEEAYKYFRHLDDPNTFELISDRWVVKKLL